MATEEANTLSEYSAGSGRRRSSKLLERAPIFRSRTKPVSSSATSAAITASSSFAPAIGAGGASCWRAAPWWGLGATKHQAGYTRESTAKARQWIGRCRPTQSAAATMTAIPNPSHHPERSTKTPPPAQAATNRSGNTETPDGLLGAAGDRCLAGFSGLPARSDCERPRAMPLSFIRWSMTT